MVRRVLPVLLLAAGSAAAQTGVAPYVGYNFTTNTLAQNSALGSGAEPPDTTGAVGINQVVSFNNGAVSIFNKDGAAAATRVTDAAFFTAAGVSIANGNVSDPRLLWDAVNQRWIALQISINESTNNRILIARSNTASPTGTWTAATLTTGGGYFADYPTLGMNADAIVIGTNNFNAAGTSNVSASLFSLPKSTLYSTTTGTFTGLTGLTRLEGQSLATVGTVPHPVVSYDGTLTNTVASLSRFNATTIRSVPVTGTGAAGATLGAATSYTIATTSTPPNAPQPATTTTQDTGDTRLSSPPVRVGGRTFIAHGTGATGGSATVAAVRFTVLGPTGTTPLFQQTLVASGSYYSYPSVGVNAAGDVVIGFTATLPGPPATSFPVGVTQAASAAVLVGTETSPNVWTFRTDAAGNPQPTILQPGTGGYTGGRWGDYSTTTPDPADPGVFWTNQEFVNLATGTTAGTSWATQASEVMVPKTGEARYQPGTAGTRAYTAATNWYGGTVPAATDHVIFSRWTSAANSQTVTVAASTAADRLSVRQTGAGTLTLSLAAGATFATANAGTATPSLAVAEFQGQARLTVTGGGTLLTQTAVVAGTAGATGVLTLDGTGTSWANSGGAFVGGSAAAAGGQGTLAVTNGATAAVSGPLTVYNAPSAALLNTVSVGTAGAAATLSAGGLTNTGAGAFPPTVTLANPASVLTVLAAGNFSGVVSGSGGLTKGGAGTQTLGGANTYTGPTAVTAGTLALAGTGSVAASPTLTVAGTLDATALTGGASFGTAAARFGLATGQTLSGSGTVNGGLTAAGGVRPGSPLTVAAGSAALLAGSGLTVRVTDASVPATGTPGSSTVGGLPAPTSNTFLDVTGGTNSLTLGNGLTVTIDGTGTAFAPATAYSYAVARAAGGVTSVGTGHTFVGLGFALDPASAALSTDGSTVFLTFSPVPEPALLLLAAAGGLGLWRRRMSGCSTPPPASAWPPPSAAACPPPAAS